MTEWKSTNPTSFSSQSSIATKNNFLGDGRLTPPKNIYSIYKEFKATPLRLCSGDFCLRKQEQELQHTYRQHGELFLQSVESIMQVYTVRRVDFGLCFLQFYAFACCLQFPQVQYREPMRGSTLKGPFFKKCKGQNIKIKY